MERGHQRQPSTEYSSTMRVVDSHVETAAHLFLRRTNDGERRGGTINTSDANVAGHQNDSGSGVHTAVNSSLNRGTSAFNTHGMGTAERPISPQRVAASPPKHATKHDRGSSSKSRKKLRASMRSLSSSKSPARSTSSKGHGKKKQTGGSNPYYLNSSNHSRQQQQERPFSIQDMLSKHQQKYSEQYRDALASS